MPGLSWFSPARLVLLVAVAAVGYFSFTAVSTLLRTHQLNTEERGLNQEITRLQAEDQRLGAIREYLQSDEYVEAIARRLLGLVRPGETLVVVSSTDPGDVQPTPTAGPTGGPGQQPRWWENLFGP